MRSTRFVASTLIAAATAFALSAPASAAPLMNGAALSQAVPSATTNVQHWHRRHYRGYHHHHGGGAGAVLGGLAAGAIIGGAIAAGQANAAAQQAQQAHAYCAQRFRSYDPRSGTYLGYDGYRHPCP